MSQVAEGTRRTSNVRTRGRAARVVERVIQATAAELSRVGYVAMRVEDVAALSGVHKTTIYRRWPTKAELVAATMVEHSKQSTPIDTGTVRGDLRASLLNAFRLKSSEQGMLRVIQMERSVPEVDALARRFREVLRSTRLAMVQRGIARGELPKHVDAELIVDLVSAPTQRALLFNETVDESYLDRVLDVVLAGAAACAANAPPRKRPSPTAKRAAKSGTRRPAG